VPAAQNYDLVWPMATLAFLTLNVIAWTEIARGLAMLKGRVTLDDFRYSDSVKVPPDLRVANRNYINLTESPILFYAACLLALHIGAVDIWFWRLAWIYVGLRIAHSLVHLADRWVPARVLFFNTSLAILALMWGKLALGL